MDERLRHDTGSFEAHKHSAAGERSVLVVDDDAAVASSIQRVLKKAGYTVSLAGNGTSAVEAIRDRPFDVVLTDIQMPGMSGIDLLSIVRAYDLDVPVVLMTGSPSLETALEALSLGALHYIVKPIGNDELVKAIERASKLHRIARAKREAMSLQSEEYALAGDRAGLQACLDRALETMSMVFQPIVDTAHRVIFGYEALMRSAEPALPHPGAVLDAAERLGRLHDVGRRVRELSALAFDRAPSDALLFVNLHTRDLLDPTLYDVHAPLAKIAHRVVLEITERSTIDDVKDVKPCVRRLRDRGFQIAIDDLGAGYAGLSSFVALEPEIVKLDMSLVRNAHESTVRQKLIESMASLSKEMGMRVIAEGVEVAGERDCVRRLGCDLLQGYFFAKPGPPFPTVAQLV